MRNIIFITITLALVFFTGCTSDFKVNEGVVEELSNKITSTVINKLDREKAERNESHTIDTTNINGLKVNGSVGNITITIQNVDEATIDVNIVAYSENSEDANKLIEDYTYEIESKRNLINIDIAQLAEKVKYENINVNLNINIPKSIEDISITNNVGNVNISNGEGKIIIKSNVGDISINNSKASYDIKNDIGNINLINCAFIGQSKLNINTGEAEITASDISEAKNIIAEIAVGDISITLPENSSYDAVINEFMEEQRTLVNGEGKTKIKLVANVGEIEIK